MTSIRTGVIFYLLAAITYVVLISWGPNSDPPRTVHLLLGFATFMCITALVVCYVAPRHFTLMAFAAIGTTLGIGIFGIFGLGLVGLISPVLLIVGTWMMRDRLDGSKVVPATVTCCLMILSPLVVTLM